MKNIVTRILNANREIIEYKIDRKLIKGLYSSTTLFKVEENCRKLNIIVNRPNLKLQKFNNVKITVLNDVCILTVLSLGFNQNQFLITKDLDLKVLKWHSSKKIERQYFELIKEAYKTMMLFDFNKEFNKIR